MERTDSGGNGGTEGPRRRGPGLQRGGESPQERSKIFFRILGKGRPSGSVRSCCGLRSDFHQAVAVPKNHDLTSTSL